MPKRNLAWMLIVAVIALLMWQLPQIIAGRDSVLRAFGPLVDARALIAKRYVEPIDEQALARGANDAAIRWMVRDYLRDPHAVYLTDDEYRNFQDRSDGRYGGIGADVWSIDDGLEVLSRERNSPAVHAGIRPGDIITHIAGISMAGVPLIDAVNLLNGPSDTVVRLRILRPSAENPAPRDIEVRRAEIRLDSARGWARTLDGGWEFMFDPHARIGYVRLMKFTPDVDERLDAAVQKLRRQRMTALILDLRENTGGLLDSALEVTDRFLESGLIVRTRGRAADEKRWDALRENTYPGFPLVVLVNASTASAAEIVAGCLRDHRRAYVIGERTYGKGSVQEVIELSAGGAIKLTTQYYYLPNGECIHRTAEAERNGTWGVAPNQSVPMNSDQRRRWLAAWREASREIRPAALVTGSAPADRPASAPTSDDLAEIRQRLLQDDAHLAAAMAYLHERLRLNNTLDATEGPHADAVPNFEGE